MAGLKKMWSQIVGFAILIGLLYAVSIPANALIGAGWPSFLAWGVGIVVALALAVALVIAWRRVRLWTDKPLAQWQDLDNQALALQKQAGDASTSNEILVRAEALYKQALAVAEASRRPVLIATALNNLAGLFIDEERWTDSIPLFERALELRQGALGADDEMTLKSRERLSGAYAAAERWADAERVQRQALATYRRLAPKSIAVPQTLDAIAVACRHQGKFDEAEAGYVEALTLLKANKEEKSSTASQILHDWGYMRREQGRNEEAEGLLRQALSLRESELEYMDTANTLDQLADLYTAEGRYSDAAEASSGQVSLVEREARLAAPAKRVVLLPLYELHARRLEKAGKGDEAAQYRSKADSIRAAASPDELKAVARLMDASPTQP